MSFFNGMMRGIGKATGLEAVASATGIDKAIVHPTVHAIETVASATGIDQAVHFADAMCMDGIEFCSGGHVKFVEDKPGAVTKISGKEFNDIIKGHNKRVSRDAPMGLISMRWTEVGPEDLKGILRKYKRYRFHGANVQHDGHHGHMLRRVVPGLQDEKQRNWNGLCGRSDFGLQIGNISSKYMAHEERMFKERVQKTRGRFKYDHVPAPHPVFGPKAKGGGAGLKWSGYRPLLLASDPKWCIDVAGGKAHNGANLILYPYRGSPNQLWSYDGKFLRSKANPRYIVDINEARMACGTNLHLWDNHGGKHQQWHYDGKVFRSAKNPRFVIDLDGNQRRSCANIHLWEANGSGAQNWRV